MAKIQINTKGIKAKIFIDGEELKGVRGYTIEHNAGGIPILKLNLSAKDLELDGDFIPALPEVYRAFYEERAN